jgi:hypothetical protein
MEAWLLQKNLLYDRGVSALIDHLPSLFPRLTHGTIHINFTSIDGNPISSKMKKRLEEELERYRKVGCLVS